MMKFWFKMIIKLYKKIIIKKIRFFNIKNDDNFNP